LANSIPTVFKTRQVFPKPPHVRQEPLSENPVSIIIISIAISPQFSDILHHDRQGGGEQPWTAITTSVTVFLVRL
jgi:hypothetical protein